MKAKVRSVVLTLIVTLGVCLLLSSMAGAQEGQPCTSDPVNMFIGYGDLITCSLDQPGIVDIYRFNGTAGQRIELVASSAVTYPCIELVGVTTVCNGYRPWIDTVLTQTQQYTIRVYDYYSNGTGAYNLDLESVVPPSPNGRQMAYGNYLTDQINPFGDLDVFFFTADVGDVVDIIADAGATYPCIELFAPDAKTVWGPVCNGYRPEITTKALTLAGTYTILVYDYYSNGYGSYSLNLDCLSGSCPQGPIPDVSGYIILRGTPLAGTGVSLAQPGAPGPQLTRTDNNGYYQFQHIISGQPFSVVIHGPASDDSGKHITGDGAAEDMVGENPSH